MRTVVARWLGIVAVSVCAALVAGEATVRLVVPEEKFWPLAPVYRAVDIPGVGYTLEPGFDGTAFGVDLRTNRFGFRGSEWSEVKPRGTLRVALLGDSHGFSYGIPFDVSLGEVMARLLSEGQGRRFEVLNFAVAGFDSSQELALFRSLVLRFEPDVIVVVASENDHEPAFAVDSLGYLYRAAATGDEAAKRHPVVHRWLEGARALAHSLLARSRLYVYARRLVEERGGDGAPTGLVGGPAAIGSQPVEGVGVDDALRASVGEPMRQLVAQARAAHIPVVFGLLAYRADYRALFHELERTEGVPVVDLLGVFREVQSWRELRERFSLGWDSHFNAAAHERWARALVERMRAEAAVPGAAPPSPSAP